VFGDVADEAERTRLRLLEEWADPNTIRHLGQVGVGPGWRCLEVGAGAGSVARWLAAEVGPSGLVVASDLNPRFLDDVPANVEVRRHDIVDDDLDVGAFDLVHSRLLLMHLTDAERALEKMVRALKPGGWLVTEEADWGLFVLHGHPDAPWATSFVHELFARHAEAGIRYPYFGRGHPAFVAVRGLENVGAAGMTGVAYGNDESATVYRLTFVGLRPVNQSVGASDADLDRLAAVLESPDVVITGVTIVTAWGRKPQPGGDSTFTQRMSG
jgi:SAM-dependent methyltransferase